MVSAADSRSRLVTPSSLGCGGGDNASCTGMLMGFIAGCGDLRRSVIWQCSRHCGPTTTGKPHQVPACLGSTGPVSRESRPRRGYRQKIEVASCQTTGLQHCRAAELGTPPRIRTVVPHLASFSIPQTIPWRQSRYTNNSADRAEHTLVRCLLGRLLNTAVGGDNCVWQKGEID